MSDTLPASAPSSSRDCPVVDGSREIQRIEARAAEVGGIPIHRAMPTRRRRVIGAWCFLDHAGPSEFGAGEPGMQVGPHPHIGLQTFTWMIAGEVLHRDSLGSEQMVRPGQVNLMTAGRGIVHTETQPDGQARLHAAQLWIALPAAHRDTDPRFDHYPEMPRWHASGVAHTLLAGEFAARRAPTLTFSPLVGVDLAWSQEGRLEVPLRTDFEYGVLALQGALQVDGEVFGADTLAYLGRGRDGVTLAGAAGSRALLLGGEPLGHEVLMWWNFVGCDRAEIAQAQRDWEAGAPRFPEVPGARGMRRMMPPPLPWVGV